MSKSSSDDKSDSVHKLRFTPKLAIDVYKYRELPCYHKCPTDTDSFSEETFGTRLPGYIKNLKALSR